MKLKNSTYFSIFDGKTVVRPKLEITVSETDNFRKGHVMIELKDNRYMSKEEAIKYLEWVIEQVKSIPET